MTRTISATAAARGFSKLVASVHYQGEAYVVEKGGEPVCQIVPVRAPHRSTAEELARIVARLPKPDAGYSKQVETVARRQPKVPRSPWGR
jgi:antitoxin (DNA-binding transcriptional repressor) of toxin-antitoxin stability system